MCSDGKTVCNWTDYDKYNVCNPETSKDCGDPAIACDKDQPGCKQPDREDPANEDPDPPDPGDSLTTPPDDFERLPCAPDWDRIIFGWHEPPDPTAPDPSIINPSPDSVDAGISNACLEAVNSSRHTTCVPSVAQCMDPWFVDENCECVPGGEAPLLTQASPNCRYVDCGEGATCDPATGLCQVSATSGFVFPGNVPPPPFR